MDKKKCEDGGSHQHHATGPTVENIKTINNNDEYDPALDIESKNY